MLPHNLPPQAVVGKPDSPVVHARQARIPQRLRRLLPNRHHKPNQQADPVPSLFNRLFSFAARVVKRAQKSAPATPKDQDISAGECPLPNSTVANQHHAESMTEAPSDKSKSDCLSNVLAIFPDIDPDHAANLCEQALWLEDVIVEQILDEQESGRPYPKARKPTLKRKREDSEDPTTPENLAKRFDNDAHKAKFKSQLYWEQRRVVANLLRLSYNSPVFHLIGASTHTNFFLFFFLFL